MNVHWGFLNLVISYLLIFWVEHYDLRSPAHIVASGLGVLFAGMILARNFGRFHGGNSPQDLSDAG